MRKINGFVLLLFTVSLLLSPLFVAPYVAAQQQEKRYFFKINFISDPANIDAVQIMKQGWEAIGIETNVVTMEFTTLFARYHFQGTTIGATYDQGGYDVAFTGWPNAPDPDSYDRYHTDAQPGRIAAAENVMLYSNGIVDKLLEQGLLTTNVTQRTIIYHQVEQIVHTELPLLYTYRDPAIKAMSKNLDLGDAVHQPATGVYDWSEKFKFTDKTGGVMTFVGDQNPPDLSGVYTTTTVAVNNIRLVQGRLIRDGVQFGTFAPDLAESWDISKDNRVYTFHIRKGVLWHDGVAFDANDVKFTFDLYRTADAGFNQYGFFSRFVKDVRMPDNYTIQLELNQPYSPALYRFGYATFILPKHILASVSPAQLKNHAYMRQPIGTGPFKVVEVKSDQYVRYETFDKFWGGRPQLDGIMFRVIPDKATGIAALEKGEVNLIEQQIYRAAVIQNYDRLKNNPSLQITVDPDNGVNPMLLNLRHPALGNLNVRKAMAMAIDIDGIIKGPYRGLAIPTPQRYPPSYAPYYDTTITNYKYDLAAAKALMEQAGYHYASLQPPTTDMTAYILPAIVTLIIGIAVGAVVAKTRAKKKTS